jgi:hypothetical protein
MSAERDDYNYLGYELFEDSTTDGKWAADNFVRDIKRKLEKIYS